MIQFYVLEVQLKKLAFVLEIPEVLWFTSMDLTTYWVSAEKGVVSVQPLEDARQF